MKRTASLFYILFGLLMSATVFCQEYSTLENWPQSMRDSARYVDAYIAKRLTKCADGQHVYRRIMHREILDSMRYTHTETITIGGQKYSISYRENDAHYECALCGATRRDYSISINDF